MSFATRHLSFVAGSQDLVTSVTINVQRQHATATN